MEDDGWFVANDAGTVAGHDMSEMGARLLASELNGETTYYIAYSGSSGDGYVGYDSDACISLDNAMTFTTREEADSTMSLLQKEWASRLSVRQYQDMSWEAMDSSIA